MQPIGILYRFPSQEIDRFLGYLTKNGLKTAWMDSGPDADGLWEILYKNGRHATSISVGVTQSELIVQPQSRIEEIIRSYRPIRRRETTIDLKVD